MAKKLSVTQVLWQIYPFDNKYFLQSLSEEWISKKRNAWMLVPGWIADLSPSLDYKNLMWMLSQFGTIIHQAAYDLGTLGFTSLKTGTVCENHVKQLVDWFEKNNVRAIKWELFIDCPDYCGISDWLYLINWQVWLIDFKTFWAYKYIYWIRDTVEFDKHWNAKLAKHDAEKVPVQLAMYDNWLKYHEVYSSIKVQKYWVLWITENGCYLVELQPNLQPFLDWKESKNKTKIYL